VEPLHPNSAAIGMMATDMHTRHMLHSSSANPHPMITLRCGMHPPSHHPVNRTGRGETQQSEDERPLQASQQPILLLLLPTVVASQTLT
jgi:hypothetical protein